MRTIETVITIEAPPDTVWDILVDFDAYSEWNPLLLWAEGDAVAGKKIKIHIRILGADGTTAQPTVLIAEPARHLQWLGKAPIPGLFSGRHEFILEPVGEGTRLVHREEFFGVLVPFIRDTLRRTEVAFRELNQALKERAEHQAG